MEMNIWVCIVMYYMGVYCYADDISLLSPTFTGLKRNVKDM